MKVQCRICMKCPKLIQWKEVMSRRVSSRTFKEVKPEEIEEFVSDMICAENELQTQTCARRADKSGWFTMYKIRNVFFALNPELVPKVYMFFSQVEDLTQKHHINISQSLLNLKGESGGFVRAVRKHTRKEAEAFLFPGCQIPTSLIGKVSRAATHWKNKTIHSEICRYEIRLFSPFSVCFCLFTPAVRGLHWDKSRDVGKSTCNDTK